MLVRRGKSYAKAIRARELDMEFTRRYADSLDY